MDLEYTFATRCDATHRFLQSLMHFLIVRSHGHRQSEETGVPLLGLPEQHADFASLHPVCCEAFIPGTTGDEYCVSTFITLTY